MFCFNLAHVNYKALRRGDFGNDLHNVNIYGVTLILPCINGWKICHTFVEKVYMFIYSQKAMTSYKSSYSKNVNLMYVNGMIICIHSIYLHKDIIFVLYKDFIALKKMFVQIISLLYSCYLTIVMDDNIMGNVHHVKIIISEDKSDQLTQICLIKAYILLQLTVRDGLCSFLEAVR